MCFYYQCIFNKIDCWCDMKCSKKVLENSCLATEVNKTNKVHEKQQLHRG